MKMSKIINIEKKYVLCGGESISGNSILFLYDYILRLLVEVAEKILK